MPGDHVLLTRNQIDEIRFFPPPEFPEDRRPASACRSPVANAIMGGHDSDRDRTSYAIAHQAVCRERDALLQALQEDADRAVAQQEQFRHAIDSRDVIGQAKGIIMSRGRVDADAAFEMLRDASSRSHRKLHTVAQAVVDHQLQRG